MKYFVVYSWNDIDGKIQTERKEFTNKSKAQKFFNSIKYTTELLTKKYRFSGVYNPYINIKLLEEK